MISDSPLVPQAQAHVSKKNIIPIYLNINFKVFRGEILRQVPVTSGSTGRFRLLHFEIIGEWSQEDQYWHDNTNTVNFTLIELKKIT